MIRPRCANRDLNIFPSAAVKSVYGRRRQPVAYDANLADAFL